MSGADGGLIPGPMEHLAAFALVLLAGVAVGAALVLVTYHCTKPEAQPQPSDPRSS